MWPRLRHSAVAISRRSSRVTSTRSPSCPSAVRTLAGAGLADAHRGERRAALARLDELERVAVVAGGEAGLGVVAVVLGVDPLDAAPREELARGGAGRGGGEARDLELLAA